MKKTRIYLDTSVISHLEAPDAPEKMERTRELWEYLKKNGCDVCLSESVLDELLQCPEPKQSKMFEWLGEIQYEILKTDQEVLELSDCYVEEKILSRKHLQDLTHLATATVHHCQILLSWNFKHIVQNKTMMGVNIVNKKWGYGELMLLSPFSFQFEEEDDD